MSESVLIALISAGIEIVKLWMTKSVTGKDINTVMLEAKKSLQARAQRTREAAQRIKDEKKD